MFGSFQNDYDRDDNYYFGESHNVHVAYFREFSGEVEAGNLCGIKNGEGQCGGWKLSDTDVWVACGGCNRDQKKRHPEEYNSECAAQMEYEEEQAREAARKAAVEKATVLFVARAVVSKQNGKPWSIFASVSAKEANDFARQFAKEHKRQVFVKRVVGAAELKEARFQVDTYQGSE